MGRGRSRGPYGGRRQGLTGNQLKILGIVAILIDNIGAVVIQGGILHGTDSALYHAVLLTPSGHYWVIAGQVCRYVGRLGFPILAYLTAEEFVRTRDRRWYAVRMLLFALLSEVPFDLAVYHTMYYPHYQNMMFTLFAGVLVMAVMESTQNPEEPQPNKKFIKILAAVIAFAAVIAVAALAYVKMTTKDPKQVVIDAFENVFPEGQVYPSEELFGLKDFAETVKTADSQGGLTLKMDSCSDATVNAYAGSGLRFEAKDDKTNGRSFFNMGVIYSGMDLANLNAYYGDDTLMLAVPELSAKVFTVDLGEGLADRIKNSPTVGPLLEQNGVDVEGMAVYFTELMDEAEKAQTEGRQPFDVEALINRYKEGCKAQENFKAALTVEKAAKGTYTIDGAQVSCKGYNVTVSKDSMIEFLRQSSDFFLQDETLKADFMRQLETTVKMSELMGGTMSGTGTMSAEEMQQQSYEEAKKMVDQMIEYLDKALTDVNMTVYVDKKGRLAAVEGSTNLYVEDTDVSEEGYIALTFSCQLQGGAYLTQNALASITLEDATDTVSIDMVKQGSYDKSVLTSDLSLDLTVPGDETYNFTYTSTYDSKDGSYHLSGEVGGNGSQLVKISAEGAVDQLEKGKSVHVNIDSLETSIMDDSVNVVLSGEYYYQPLEGEISPLEGETMDVLSATEEDWTNVGMEMLFGVMGLGSQMGVSMY
mgnify:CR=1 FL=1